MTTPIGVHQRAFDKLELEWVVMNLNSIYITMNQESVQAAVLTLLQRYVARQQLAADAMQHLRPDLWFQAHQKEWTAALLVELKALQTQVAGIPQKGYWGEHDEWEYFFHGGGCRLVHTSTGEPIDWDAPNIRRFDKFRFLVVSLNAVGRYRDPRQQFAKRPQMIGQAGGHRRGTRLPTPPFLKHRQA